MGGVLGPREWPLRGPVASQPARLVQAIDILVSEWQALDAARAEKTKREAERKSKATR